MALLSFFPILLNCSSFFLLLKVWPGILGKPNIGNSGFKLARGISKSFQVPRVGSEDYGHKPIVSSKSQATELVPPATVALLKCYATALTSRLQQPKPSSPPAHPTPRTTMTTTSLTSSICRWRWKREEGQGPAPAQGGSEKRVRVLLQHRLCNNACGAFETPEFCCNMEHGSPPTCKLSIYSDFQVDMPEIV